MAAKITDRLKKTVEQQWGAKRFVVLFYLGWPADRAEKFKTALEREGVETIDLAKINLAEVAGEFTEIPYEHHTSAAGAYGFAAQIRSALKHRGILSSTL